LLQLLITFKPTSPRFNIFEHIYSFLLVFYTLSVRLIKVFLHDFHFLQNYGLITIHMTV